MEEIKKRVDTYDIMKFFGIIMVIVGHMTHYFSSVIFSFHMPLFFILAGYFYHEKDVRTLFQSDFKHLVYPYIVTALAIFATYLVLSLCKSNIDLKFWAIAMLYGSGSTNHSSLFFAKVPAIGAIWFLLALFWCKNLFNMLFHYTKHWLLWSVLASAVAIVIDRYYINLPWAILPGVGAMLFYAIGYFIKEKSGFLHLNPLMFSIFVLVWLVSFMMSDMSMVRCYYQDFLINVIGAIGGTYALFLVSDLISTTHTRMTKIVIWGRPSENLIREANN